MLVFGGVVPNRKKQDQEQHPGSNIDDWHQRFVDVFLGKIPWIFGRFVHARWFRNQPSLVGG